MCAKDSLSGPAVIAYADTLIRADFDLDKNADSVIWVKQVDQPEAFGVVKLNEANEIVELVENRKHLFQIWLSLGFIILKMWQY
jgi:glucose-1-phosphate thymidylyltransferase